MRKRLWAARRPGRSSATRVGVAAATCDVDLTDAKDETQKARLARLAAGGVRQRRPYTPLLSEGPRVAMPVDGNPIDPMAESGPNVSGRGVAEDLREAGRMFGSDHWHVDPDLWVCAKGLAAGYWPVAMVGMRRRISSAFEERNVDFVHRHTFENHAVGCAAALAVLEQARAPGFLEGIAGKGERLREKILALPDDLPIKLVRGQGILLGIHLGYADAHFDPVHAAATRVVQAAQRRGLMLYPAADPTGFGHDKLIVSPPYVITEAQIETVVERFEQALCDARLDVSA